MEQKIPDGNLFMICPSIQTEAFAALPEGYVIRNCRESELALWKAMPFDDPETAREQEAYMTSFFHQVYEPRRDEFFSACRFVCDFHDRPVATCFLWKAYGGAINTLHWLKVKKECEGQGIGRALLTALLRDVAEAELPIYLHTQPSSFRAIKLYTDFGFRFLTDAVIGNRKNDLRDCLPILERYMYAKDYARLSFLDAPEDFLQSVASSEIPEF